MREFESGATRDGNDTKFNYIGFLSPFVLEQFASYMHANRIQADGKPRAADNWKKGIPRQAYIESLARHFIELWQQHEVLDEGGDLVHHMMLDTLSAILFNTMGYMHELSEGR